jgi:putative ABC transport system ATP-binding protein
MTLRVECEELVVGWSQNPLVNGIHPIPEFAHLNYVLPIIGHTGLGKSTLLYALAGMARPLHGRVRWQLPLLSENSIEWSNDNRSFNGLNQLRRKRFGFCLQDASMIECFTVAENLRHTLRLRGVVDDVEARIARAVSYMIAKDDSPTRFLNKYPVTLSGGERQRMALAAAIAHDPVVLFADEPTASLDVEAEFRVLDALRGWLDDESAKLQRAFVFVTHRIETLREGIGARQVLALRALESDNLHRAQNDNRREVTAELMDVRKFPARHRPPRSTGALVAGAEAG